MIRFIDEISQMISGMYNKILKSLTFSGSEVKTDSNGKYITINRSDTNATYNLTTNLASNPTDYNTSTFKWTSSDSSYTSVDTTGKITCYKRDDNGTNIIVDSFKGITATIRVLIKQLVTDITISGDTSDIETDGTNTRTYTDSVLPSDANDKSVTWSTDIPTVATSMGNGVIKFLTSGNVKVSVSTNDGSNKSATSNNIYVVNLSDYSGANLVTKYSSEIANFSNDVWAWIKNRINNGNYTGIHVGDYIPTSITYTNNSTTTTDTINVQIAGIDTYNGDNGGITILHHIDFISSGFLSNYDSAWNDSEYDNNNGSDMTPYPWIDSVIFSALNYNIYNSFSSTLKSQITQKRMLLEQRYTAGTNISSDNGQSWSDIGNLWLPTEYEVFGSLINSDATYGKGNSIKYALYNNLNNKIKSADWWLLSVSAIDYDNACYVNTSGSSSIAGNFSQKATYTVYKNFPICFRISSESNRVRATSISVSVDTSDLSGNKTTTFGSGVTNYPTRNCTFTITPSNATTNYIEWYSSNESVAFFKNKYEGKAYFNSSGTVYFYAKTVDGSNLTSNNTGTINVTVTSVS
jgi:uncharacterized protein YjdB